MTTNDTDESDTDRIEVDGATIKIGNTTILVTEDSGEPATLDHTSEMDGYAAYVVGDENVTLHFMEGSE